MKKRAISLLLTLCMVLGLLPTAAFAVSPIAPAAEIADTQVTEEITIPEEEITVPEEEITVPEEETTVPTEEGELQSVQTYTEWTPTCEIRNNQVTGDKRKVVYGNGYPLKLTGSTCNNGKLYTHISYGAMGYPDHTSWNTSLDLSGLNVDSFAANGSIYYDLSTVTIYGGTGTVDTALHAKVPIDYGGDIYMAGGEVASLVGGSRINGCNNTKIVMVGGKVNGNIYGGSMGCSTDFREYSDKYFDADAVRDHTLYTYIATVRETMTLSIDAEVGGRIYGGGYAYACTGSGNVYVSRASTITGVNGEKVVNGPEILEGGSYLNGYIHAYYIDLLNGAHSVNNTGAVNYMVLQPGFSTARRTDLRDENHIVRHDCKNALYTTANGFELKGKIDPSVFPNADTDPFRLLKNEQLRLPAGSVLNLTTAKLKSAGAILLYSGGSIIGTNGHIINNTGIGNPTGKVIFPITAADIADIPDMPFTGFAIKPSVALNRTPFPLLGKTYYPDTDNYNLTYTNNVNAGRATATLTNKYDSSLSISKSFTIEGLPCEIADAQFVESETLLHQQDGSVHAYYTSELLVEKLRVKFTSGGRAVVELPATSRIKMGDSSKGYAMATVTSTMADKDGYFTFTFQNRFPHELKAMCLTYLSGGNFAPCSYVMPPKFLQYVIQCPSTGNNIFLPTSTPMTLHAGKATNTITFTCNEGHTSKEFSLSGGEIYKYNEGQNDITMGSGTVGTIYAGSYYESDFVPLGKVTINGGTLTTLAAARDDSNQRDKTTRAELTVNGGNVGTIRSARTCGETYITVTGGTVGTITGVSSKNSPSKSMHLLISGGTVGTLDGKLDSNLGKKSDLIVTKPLVISGWDTFDNRLYFNGNYYVLENTITLWDDLTLGGGNLVTAAASQLTVPAGKTLTVPADAKVSGSGKLAIQKDGHLALTAGIVALSQESYPAATPATPAKPAVTVKLLDKTFTENVDYTVTYANNTSAGIATATVTAKAGSPLSGTVVLQYDISAAAGTVALEGYALSRPYTGKPIPNPTSEQVQALSRGAVTFTWYKGTLTMDQLDMAISLCVNPTEGGDYTLLVKVAGDGTYAPATALAHITIVNTPDDAAASSSGNQIKPGSGWYTGDVTLKAPTGYLISTGNTVGGSWKPTLVITEDMNRDYTYYLKNSETGAITTKKTIHVQKDTVPPAVDVDLSNKHGFQYTVTLSSMDLSGIAVCRYFDYTDGYLKGDPLKDPATYVDEIYARAHSKLATGMVFEATTIPGARAKLYLFLEDAAGHTSVVQKTDNTRCPVINAAEIVTTIDPVAYTGGQISFNKDEVTATYHGKVLPSSHYDIGAGSTDCLPGTYQAMLYPINAHIGSGWQKTYEGDCTPAFTILKAPLQPKHIQLTDAPVYTGIPYIPENIKVKLTDNAVEGPEYFDMVGVDNVNVGTAYITVKMKDSAKYFSGEATIPVTIGKGTANINLLTDYSTKYTGQEIKSVPSSYFDLSCVSYDELQFTFYNNAGVTLGDGVYPKDAGSYRVDASVPATNNHTAARSGKKSFTIEPSIVKPEELPVIILDQGEQHTINLATAFNSYLPAGETYETGKITSYSIESGGTTTSGSPSNDQITYSSPVDTEARITVLYPAKNSQILLTYRFIVGNGLTLFPEGTIRADVPETVLYTGSAYAVTAELTDAAHGGGNFTYQYAEPSGLNWNNIEASAVVNCKNYRVVITYRKDKQIATLTKYFKIVPIASTITAVPEKATYTYGEMIKVTVGVPNSGDVTLYCGDVPLTSRVATASFNAVPLSYNPTGHNALKAGKNTIRAEFSSNDTQTGLGRAEFEITLVPRPVTATVQDRPYAVGDATAPLSVDAAVLSADKGKVAVSAGTISSPNVGTYTVTGASATLTGQQAQYYQLFTPENLTFTITTQVLSDVAPNAVTIADIAPLTYTGSAQTPTLTIKDGGTELMLNTDYTVAYSANTEVGTATATVTFKGNYSGTMTKSFTIGKAASTLGTPVVKNGDTVTSTFTYGDTITITFTPQQEVAAFELTEPTANQAALYLGETQLTDAVTADGNGQFTLSYATVDKGIPTGSQLLTIKYGGSASLGAGSASATITLNPKLVTATVSGTITKEYDTTATATVTLAVAKVSPGDAITVTADATYNNADVGTGKAITFSNLSQDGTHSNYYTVSAPASTTGAITAKQVANPTITLEHPSYTYTGSAIQPVVTSVKDGANTIPATEYTVAYSANTDVSNTATVTIADAANGNYTVSGTKTFTITKSESTTTPGASTTTATYGDTITLTATVGIKKTASLAASNQVEFFCGQTSLGTAEVSNNTATLAYNTTHKKLQIGDNTITATFSGNDNLLLNNSKTNTITVNLKAKQLTGAVVSNAAKVYDGTADFANVAVTLTDVLPGDTVAATAAFTVADKNVGTAKGMNNVVVTLPSDDAKWYIAPTSLTGTVAITAKPITVLSVTVADKTYDAATTATITAMTFHDLVAGDSLTYSVDVTATATFADAAAANGKTVNIADIVLSSVKAKNYSLSVATFATTGTISPAGFTAPATIAITTDTNVAEKLDAGDVLTATVTGLQGTLTYQWQNNSVNMVGKTSNTYTLEAGKIGTISCVVTSSGNVVGEQTSNTLEIGKITLEGDISITGGNTPGSELTLNVGNVTPSAATYTILWSTGATGTTYTVAPADLGKTITVTITATGDYTGTLTAELTIPAVAPDAPVITAVAGDGKVTINWAAPFNGGSAIIGYTLTVTPAAGGSPIAVAPGATSYEVTSLTNDTKYTFKLVATNTVGGSAASSEATATPIGMRTVTFNTNGGNTIDPVQVANGGTITAPTPTKPGYDFAGWFTDAELTVSFVQSTPITANMTLYAKWTVQQTGGGSGSGGGSGGGSGSGSGSGSGGGSGGGAVNRKPVWERFTDILADAWYTESVQFVVDNGLFSGTSKTTFSPHATTTRGMLWTVLYRHAGATTKGEGTAWYADAQAWAKEIGISDGTNPEGEISREQLATILYRYAKGTATTADMSKFSDTNEISGFAAEAMNWAVEQGILQGANGKLNPKASASRAEVAAMVTRFVTSAK